MRKKLKPNVIHEKHNIRPDLKTFHILHAYDRRIHSWMYYGHICIRCGNKFKSEKAMLIHLNACRYRHGKFDKRVNPELHEPYILDIHGNEWKSITADRVDITTDLDDYSKFVKIIESDDIPTMDKGE